MAEPSSSSLTCFTTSSSYISTTSNYCSDTTGSTLEIVSLSKLSSNLEQLITTTDCCSDYRDAEIVVENIPVGVHRCILACRSEFFSEIFRKKVAVIVEEGGVNKTPKYDLNKLLPFGKVGYEAFLIFLSYVYTGKLKPSPPEVSTCVFNPCDHEACRPAIEFAVELMYASSIFKIPELVSLLQRRLLNFVGKAAAEDVIPILMVAFHCNLSQLLTLCVERIMRSDLDAISLEKELPYEISENIKLLRKSQMTPLPNDMEVDEASAVSDDDPLRQQQEKRIRRIYKALDSDDVELVNLLLSESKITLDEANALHYAVAYCDPKVVSELLGLHLADINRRNLRGYTVLHVAAMRKEAKIIVSLLSKGASVSELTPDGQSAVTICRRLTRPKDYNAKIEQGKESNKDRLCIDVLERELRRKPFDGEALISSPLGADDLHMKLLYLENRVAFARLFFPAEAKLAMDVANADTTYEFAGLLSGMKGGGNGNLEREVDLNETPLLRNKRLLSRMEALQKTVETGRRYFPHCSQVLDKFMEDDLPDLCYLERGTPEERRIKTTRFMEVKEDVQKAFSRDKAERSGISSSSSSNSLRNNHKSRKLL